MTLPGRGIKVSQNVKGSPFDARVVEEEDRIVVKYEAEIEDQFPQRAQVLNALNQFVGRAGLGGSSKEVVFDAV